MENVHEMPLDTGAFQRNLVSLFDKYLKTISEKPSQETINQQAGRILFSKAEEK